MDARVMVEDFLTSLVASRGLGDQLCEANTSLSFNLVDIGIALTMNLYSDDRRGLVTNLPAEKADISLDLTSELAADLFARKVDLWNQLASGAIRLRGDGGKVSSVWASIQFAGPRHFRNLPAERRKVSSP